MERQDTNSNLWLWTNEKGSNRATGYIGKTHFLCYMLRLKDILAFENCKNNFQYRNQYDLLLSIITLYIEREFE
jgi:hypothetical protein